ncbi:MAG: TIGR04076 family protein [Promethearchaeota archaeon]
MTNVKITVIKKFHPRDVFDKDIKYPSGNIARECQSFNVGDEFIVENGCKPTNFCDWAWRDVYKDVAVLRFGGNFNHTEPGVIYTCCTDGMKPVCFKMERI